MATDASRRDAPRAKERTADSWGARRALPQRINVMFRSPPTWRDVMYIGIPIIGLALILVLVYFMVTSRTDTSPTRR
jgi:hypothetical protein